LEKIEKNKTKISAIAFVLLLTFAATLVTLPTVSAHDPAWEVPTYAYLTVEPNPIGVDQTATIVYWLDKVPPTAAGTGGDRWQDITVEITAPDGSQETLGPFTSDPVGGGWTLYTPNQVGTYTFEVIFPGQVASLTGPTGLEGSASDYVGDYYLPSSATVTLTVQEDPIAFLEDTPVTDDYWTRPIEGQNTNWASIGSHWLSGSQIVGKYQPDGIAPESPHIMWTKEISFGGVVGGSFAIDGITYYDGTNYENKFMDPLIINGRLYYTLPLSDASSGGGYICVDLQTGEEIWLQDYATSPSFGQLYDYESFNQHGVIPNGYLWSTDENPFAAMFGLPAGPTTWTAYDPYTGSWLFNLTNIPSGTEVYGPNGEIMRYVLDVENNWLALWNSTAAPDLAAGLTSSDAYQWRPMGKNVDASTAYTWNVTIPELSADASIRTFIPNDMILLSTSTASFLSFGTPDPITVWAISLQEDSRGELLWTEDIAAPAGNVTRSFGPTDPTGEARVFTMFDEETISWSGYSLDDGSLLWTTDSENPWNFYSGAGGALTTSTAAYGKLYSTGYSGIVYCYDLINGTLLWEYVAEAGFAAPYGNYPLGIAAIADGKLYLTTNEHSSGSPYWKGAKMRCIDAETGEEIWTLDSHGASSYGDYGYAVADGYLVYLNLYDMQVYCIGKGPSKTTVEAPLTAVTLGSSVMIRGTVTDQSAGTEQDDMDSRFPNGVPAVSDEDMADWMEYLYMQKTMPEDVTGVTVKLTSIDPNGNYQDIGEVTTDISGSFGISWVPPVPGEYYVLAEFEGSESYGSSYATTYFVVDSASSVAASIEPEPTTPESTTPLATEFTTTASSPPFITTEVAIIAAVSVACVVGIVSFWALRKRK
jgi:outer membrane protein assembly factor BamB